MLTDHSALPVADARAVLAASRHDPQVHAGVALLLLAGLRPTEIETLRGGDYMPGAEPLLCTGAERFPRTIRIAPTVAAALDAYVAGHGSSPAGFLLPGLGATRCVQIVRRVADAAEVQAGVHDLRKAAISAVLEDGTPVHHVEAYFGMRSTRAHPSDPPTLTARYDAAIANVLEETFA